MAITLTDRLRKIINPRVRGRGRLPPAEDKSAILGGRGIGTPLASEAAGGIVSPLTEVAGSRTYKEEEMLTSSDGIFVIVYEPIASSYFIDGDGNDLVVIYNE